jgi:hypothetical protein
MVCQEKQQTRRKYPSSHLYTTYAAVDGGSIRYTPVFFCFIAALYMPLLSSPGIGICAT